ncbi:MAG: AAA family ATPase [Candidatus Mycalebacterium zealandia]|nr:MAG: AAA family ATPase [Candidatus Mycalebacterium zealandia]
MYYLFFTKMISLKISEIDCSDMGKGVAKLSRNNMHELGLEPFDTIEIGGKRKTVARAVPLETEDGTNENIIEIDSFTRRNARSEINDFVIVRKSSFETAKRVTVAVSDKTVLYERKKGMDAILSSLLGLALTKGDRVGMSSNGKAGNSSKTAGEIYVISAVPSSPNPIVIDETTEITIAKLPANMEENRDKTRYARIGGLKKQINKIREIVEIPVRFPEVFARLGIEPPRGILLIGPPGSGKTMLAKSAIHETGMNFQIVNGPEIISKHYGESEARIREIFETAQKKQPSIVFLDELDAIAPHRDKVAGEVEKRVVAQLLTMMDGLEKKGNVIVIGATNLPDLIDPALRRAGRFDREILLDVPDSLSRIEILKIHCEAMPLSKDVDFQRIAELTNGFTGADIEMLCKEAGLKALGGFLEEFDGNGYETKTAKKNKKKNGEISVSMENFTDALKEVEPSAIREISVDIPETGLESIGGLKEIKNTLFESVIMPLRHRELYKTAEVTPPRGIMLCGAPGTGKTLIARALANECGVNFISIKGAEMLSKYVGESERAIRNVFSKARQVAPSIIFFDEIDALAPVRRESEGNRVSEQVVSQMLAEMDGIEELSDVQVLAATNRRDIVDPALMRSGRFDLILNIPLPDRESIEEILKIHIGGKPLAKNVNFKTLAAKMKGMSGADVKLVCDKSSIFALNEQIKKRDGKTFRITNSHFLKSLKEVSEKSAAPARRGG